MKESLLNKIQQLVSRHEEISGLLSDPEVIADQNRFRDLSREYARLEPVSLLFGQIEKAERDLQAAQEMLEDPDAEIRSLGQEELAAANDSVAVLEQELRKYLVPRTLVRRHPWPSGNSKWEMWRRNELRTLQR